MDYQFKKFEGKNTRLENRISITKSNQIGLPTQFYRNNNIEKFKYADLYWDNNKKSVGIHFTNDKDDKSSFSIIHNEKYGGAIVITSFLKANNIDVEKYAGRYDWKKQNLEGVGNIYIIELKEKTKG